MFLEYELIQLASRVAVTRNLEDHTVQFIAREFIALFPNSSIADIRLCFRNGARGDYGKIYWLDGIVIRGWMEKYLEAQAIILERPYKPVEPPPPENPADIVKPSEKPGEWLEVWKKSVENATMAKPVRPLTNDEVRREGQVKPPKRQNYPSSTIQEHRNRELRNIWIRECYDPYLLGDKLQGVKLENWKPFEEWLVEYRNRKPNKKKK